MYFPSLKDNLIMMRCKDDVEQVCQAAGEEGEDGEEVKAGREREVGNEPGLFLHWEPKGSFQKRFSGFCPLRGGEYPPIPLRNKSAKKQQF